VRIAEIFYSIQGEGRLVGTPAVFIRTSGCNLRCVWCDTPYTSWSPEGEERSVGEILSQVTGHPHRHIVLTGGEPLLAGEIEQLTTELRLLGSHITIETAATIFKPVTCDLVSMSPKLAHSTPWSRARGKFAEMHERARFNAAVIQQFMDTYDYQLKFVVQERDDFAEIQALLGGLKNVAPARVLIMAQGTTARELRAKRSWIIELCKVYGFRYTPRLHIDLFGNRRGT
jgi:7-carboxy-7-deazaguanine synthase